MVAVHCNPLAATQPLPESTASDARRLELLEGANVRALAPML